MNFFCSIICEWYAFACVSILKYHWIIETHIIITMSVKQILITIIPCRRGGFQQFHDLNLLAKYYISFLFCSLSQSSNYLVLLLKPQIKAFHFVSFVLLCYIATLSGIFSSVHSSCIRSAVWLCAEAFS